MHKVEAASKLLEVSLLPVRVGTSALKLLHKVEAASKLLEVSLLPVRVGTSAVKLGWRLPPSLEVSLSFL